MSGLERYKVDTPAEIARRRALVNEGEKARIPPYDIEAEMAVLGGMMLGGDKAVDTANEILRGTDFYRVPHGMIFNTITRVRNAGEHPDIVTLKSALESSGELAAVGGVPYLMEMGEFVPTAANLRHYARIVREKSNARSLIYAAEDAAEILYETSDAEAFQRAAGVFQACIEQSREGVPTEVRHIRRVIDEETSAIEERSNRLNDGGFIGVPTGFHELDSLLGGMQKGELILIAGRPSMGKSSLAGCIGMYCQKSDYKVHVSSVEMRDTAYVNRALSAETGINAKKLRNSALDMEEFATLMEGADRLAYGNMTFDDSERQTPTGLRTSLRNARNMMGGLDLAIVDYIQLMRSGINALAGDERREVSYVATELQSIAKEFDVPIIVVSQLNRNVDGRADKRPGLADLAESGKLEQVADVTIFVYRPGYYAPRTADYDPSVLEEAEIIVAKGRNSGTGVVKLGWRANLVRFENLPAEIPW